MLNNRHLWQGRILGHEASSLGAFPGIFQGGVVGGGGNGRGPYAHIDARLVHHLEHVWKPLVGFPHQISATVVVLSQTQLGDGRAPVT